MTNGYGLTCAAGVAMDESTAAEFRDAIADGVAALDAGDVIVTTSGKRALVRSRTWYPGGRIELELVPDYRAMPHVVVASKFELGEGEAFDLYRWIEVDGPARDAAILSITARLERFLGIADEVDE